ncbi:MAG: glycosyltransferase family 29 protein [Acetobacteraceae bacterium]
MKAAAPRPREQRAAARAEAARLVERLRAMPPAGRAPALAAFLRAHPPLVAAAHQLWSLRATDADAFDAGLDAAHADTPGHPLIALLRAWRTIRMLRHEEAKDIALEVLLAKPGAREWQQRLLRSELVAPSADDERRRRIWQAALPAFADGLPRAAILAQQAVSLGLPPDRERLDAALADAAPDALALPPADATGGEAVRRRLAEILDMLRDARDIALVGNAPTLAGSGGRAEIDRHDLFVRCNYPPLAGFEADAGRRTGLMLLHGTKRNWLGALLANHPNYPALPALSCVVSGPPEASPPEPPDHHPRPAAPPALERLVDTLGYAGKTTGLFGAVLIGLVLGKPLRLYGFDSFRPGSAGHYFGAAGAGAHHDLAYERWYLTRFLPTIRPAVTLHDTAPP